MTLRLLAYVSDFACPAGEARGVADSIIAAAKDRNARDGLTGVLFFANGRFVQILEGPEKPLRALMEAIEADTRHRNLTYLIDTDIQLRGFAEWHMELFYLDEGKRFDTETLALLTSGFMKSQLMRSDVLSYYYKAAMG